MKKKTLLMTSIVVVLLILLIPIRMNLKDGGSVSYKSIIYEITKIHQLAENTDGVKPYIDGYEIKILGMTVYRQTDEPTVHTTQSNSPEIVGKTFMYEKGGFSGVEGDNFEISINNDGTWTYTEGLASSHFALPEKCSWVLKDGILALTEKMYNDVEHTNYFKVDGAYLIYQADGSANFIYTKVEDGDKFIDKSQLDKIDNQITVRENFVSKMGKGTLSQAVDLSEEDASSLLNIVESKDWVEDKPKCIHDCAITLKGNLYYYHSYCGTLERIDLSEVSTQSSKEPEKSSMLIFDEKTKHLVNTLLKKYIDLEQ